MFFKGGGVGGQSCSLQLGGSHFLAPQKVFFDEKILGGKGLRPDLETPQVDFLFNSSESVFRVKTVGGSLSHEGGGGSEED